ncbi:uncharacterized protein LOC130666017 [Microplitis mediator]|uniref:uncharacterized protein LOC130666017 n=1 Tax=Microplitis mediator TaxID=375433 RepID=UPI002555539A|nr:uncharacterized protein LOC130666017 [Microplitis mediator]
MTAATLISNESEAKSPLPKNKKYEDPIIDDDNSIKIFPSKPLLNICLQSLLLITFLLVLIIIFSPPMNGSAMASMSKFLYNLESNETLLSMDSELNPNRTLSCIVGEVRDDRGELQYRECIITLSKKDKLTWISYLIIAYTLPEFINSFLCFRKAKSKPSIGQFFLVFIPETFHTIGVALMIFEVLPKLNYHYCLLFVIWCVIECGLQTPILAIYGTENIKRKKSLIFFDIVCLGIFINFTIFNPMDGINRNNSECWIAMLALALLHCGLWQDISNSKFSSTGLLPAYKNARKILKPVRHSIYAWVSLWKIIVFFASSFVIYVINHGNTTHLFAMFGDAFSLNNVTDIPFQRFVQIDVNDTYYNDEFINFTKRLLYPLLILSTQGTIALFINTRTRNVLWSVIKKLKLPSHREPNIPFMVSIFFVLFSGFFRSLNNYLSYHIPLSEQLKNFFSEIHVSNVVSKFFHPDSRVNWGAHLLILSLWWIVVLHFMVLPAANKSCKVDKKIENPETETPPIVEVHVVSENGTVEEKENLNAD